MTLKEYATAYVETVMGPANGHGQCVHPTLGISHGILQRMSREFGTEETMTAIDTAFEEYRNAR